jgi:tetratricopeptide (TPR) repeat protein
VSDAEGLEWLRRALGRDYRLDQVIDTPGEDVVRVLARDLSLDRPVELVALRPEATTDARTRSFLEWARLLARVNHPNVAGVYRAEVLRGVPCVAVEHPEGETLAARLRHSPLRTDEARRLGRDMLRGLEASHAIGVARPGLDADAIICAPERFVLIDLGRALTESASAEADLYTAAALLYQSVAGHPWNPVGSADTWRPVPRRFRAVLRRALASRSADRWPDAAAFRRELESLVESPSRWPSAAVAICSAILAATSLGIWAIWPHASRWLCLTSPGPIPREVALLPLEGAGDPGADTLGFAVANIVQYTLDDLPGLERTPWREVVRYWERQGRAVDGADAARDLKVHWAAHGLLTRRGDSLRVRLTIYDEQGARRSLPEIHGSIQALAALADTVGVQLLRSVAPELEPLYAPLPELSPVPLGALKAFFQGEAAFARDEWELAARNYEIAIREDPSFALARWRQANVRRWQRLPSEFDLRTFYQEHGSGLRPLDRALVEALLESDVQRRIARLESAVAMAPADAYARFLYAEELFHRGPLVGRHIEVAGAEMGKVIALDSSFADAYNHLFAIQLRAGHRAEAGRILNLRRCVALRSAPGDLDKVQWLTLAYDERFVQWRGALRRRYLAWWAGPAVLADVAHVARLGVPWFDIPATQIALDRIILERQASTDSARASARTGIALGLMAFGRPDAALAQLDSAVALFPSAEARLQQAEWRAVAPFVGLPLGRSAADPAWDARLEALTANSSTRTRALWALALRSLAADPTHAASKATTGDAAAFERARIRLDSVAPGSVLATLLRAVGEGAHGQPARALAIADSIRPFLAVDHPPDPFAGVVFHLRRGDWLAAQGDRLAADGEWAWYDGSDFDGWPEGVAQAGEIEGAFGTYARWRRGSARLAHAVTAADTLTACALLARSETLWRHAEPAMAGLRAALDRQAKVCPR